MEENQFAHQFEAGRPRRGGFAESRPRPSKWRLVPEPSPSVYLALHGNVRLWLLADIQRGPLNVRFRG